MPGGDRSAVDPLLASVLATGVTHEEAAQVVGVSTPTVRRRLRDPAFRERLDAATDAVVDRLRSAVVEASLLGVEALVELAGHAESERVRLESAIALVSVGLRVEATQVAQGAVVDTFVFEVEGGQPIRLRR